MCENGRGVSCWKWNKEDANVVYFYVLISSSQKSYFGNIQVLTCYNLNLVIIFIYLGESFSSSAAAGAIQNED